MGWRMVCTHGMEGGVHTWGGEWCAHMGWRVVCTHGVESGVHTWCEGWCAHMGGRCHACSNPFLGQERTFRKVVSLGNSGKRRKQSQWLKQSHKGLMEDSVWGRQREQDPHALPQLLPGSTFGSHIRFLSGSNLGRKSIKLN